MSCAAVQSGQQQGVLQAVQTFAQSVERCPRHRQLISGTFNSKLLHILSFDTLTRTLSLLSSLPAYGPHTFLTPGRTAGIGSGRLVDTVYATTWAEEKELCAWRLQWSGETVAGLQWLGNVAITATSSYVHVQPPPYNSLTAPSYGVPYDTSRFMYSAGGPTGEVHAIDAATGALQDKVQEIVFLRGGEKDVLSADKTRKALRYGAHNVDVARGNLAFVADVGRNSILTYTQDPMTGALSLLGETAMPAEKDGPRHVVPSPCGRLVFSVTEHTSFVDVFHVEKGSQGVHGSSLKHVQRTSILPNGKDLHQYRGDTVRLSPDGKHLFATTRGMHVGIHGYVKVWRIDDDAMEKGHNDRSRGLLHETLVYETRNSGGKANAIEFAPRYGQQHAGQAVDYAVLTDDEQGYITVLEWDGQDLRDAAMIQLPPLDDGELQGASQAIWVS